MKVLHITPKTDGYKIVTLISNAIDKHNSLALIEDGGQYFMTGGILMEANQINIDILDSIPKEKQYSTMVSLRSKPFVSQYPPKPISHYEKV